MPTPVTFIAERTAVAKPIDTDIVNIDQLDAAIVGVGNRAEWASKALIVPSIKAPDLVGNDVVAGTSFSTVGYAGVEASFTLTLAIGDLVLLDATGAVELNAQNYGFFFRWFDGLAALTEVSRVKGAAWVAGETVAYHLGAVFIASAAGAKTFTFQSRAANVALIGLGVGAFQARCIHVKLGAP